MCSCHVLVQTNNHENKITKPSFQPIHVFVQLNYWCRCVFSCSFLEEKAQLSFFSLDKIEKRSRTWEEAEILISKERRKKELAGSWRWKTGVFFFLTVEKKLKKKKRKKERKKKGGDLSISSLVESLLSSSVLRFSVGVSSSSHRFLGLVDRDVGNIDFWFWHFGSFIFLVVSVISRRRRRSRSVGGLEFRKEENDRRRSCAGAKGGWLTSTSG